MTFELAMVLAALGFTPKAVAYARRGQSFEEATAKFDALKEIARHAYKHYAREYHPDRGGDAEMFKLLSAGYEMIQKMVIKPAPVQAIRVVRDPSRWTQTSSPTSVTGGYGSVWSRV
jgi:hypothetical protein